MLLILLFIFLLPAFSCPEGGSFYQNPDGSIGGFVGKRAKVKEGAYLSPKSKVCDFAFVDSSAELRDEAKVSGYAVVGPFSIISGFAHISDQAMIKGIEKFKTEISGNAQVRGSSRVLRGSKISDYSIIEGSPELIATTVSGNSKVCKNYQLRNEKIIDSNYFCPQFSNEKSRSTVELVGIKPGLINLPGYRIKLIPTPDTFKPDKRYVYLQINGTPVAPADFNIEEELIEFDGEEYFSDKENTIELQAQDNSGRLLRFSESAYIAKQVKYIDVSPSMGMNAAVLALAEVNGSFIEMETKVGNNSIVIPDVSAFATKVKIIIGNDSYIYANAFDGAAIPENIEMYQVPAASGFQNLDFSNGLAGWFVNDPNQVTQMEDEQGSLLKIDSSAFGPVVVARQFNLNADNRSIQFAFSASTLSDFAGKILSNGMDIFHYSKTLKKIFVTDFSPSYLEASSRAQGGVRNIKNLADSYVIQQNDEAIISGLVTYESTINGLQSDQQSYLKAEIPPFATTFNLLNHNVYNFVDTFISYPTDILGNHGCGDDYIITSESDPDLEGLQFTFQESLEFLSVGAVNYLFPPAGYRNRIYADLKLDSVYRGDVLKIEFEILQEGSPLAAVPLSKCWADELHNPRDASKIVHFVRKKSLAHYLFELDQTVLLKIDPTKKIVIAPKIVLKNGKVYTIRDFSNRNTVVSNGPKFTTRYLKPLVWLNLDSQYYDPARLDYYDSGAVNMSRIGGEKWMRPELVDEAKNLIDWNGWIINDATKANGGEFNEPHGRTHRDGADLDIDFNNLNGVRLDFDEPWVNSGETKESGQLLIAENINSWLHSIGDVQNKIKDIYVTVTRAVHEASTSLKPDYPFILDTFHARCVNGRYIDLVNPRIGRRSLLRNVPFHADHLHVRFNTPEEGDGGEVIPSPPSSSSLEDLIFEVKDKRLRISSRNSDTAIAWKISNGPFTSSAYYDYGSAQGSLIQEVDMDGFLDLNKSKTYTLDLVFANTRNGGCIPKKIVFNGEGLCPEGDKFTIKNTPSSRFLAVSESSTVSSYVINNSGGAICGNSNIQGQVTVNGRVTNVSAIGSETAPVSLFGPLTGAPSITIATTGPSYVGGMSTNPFVGNMSMTGNNKISIEGKGYISANILGISASVELDGKLDIATPYTDEFPANIEIGGTFKGSHNFNGYKTIDVNMQALGSGNYDGSNVPDSYLLMHTTVSGSSTITGNAQVNGGPYDSLTLKNGLEQGYAGINLNAAGGSINISGSSEVLLYGIKGFTLSHTCDKPVRVLSSSFPDNFSVNPNADNRSNYTGCNSSGTDCDPIVYCIEP